ncbi:MAG TPA: hypothetical protein VJR03_03395 [Nitrospira sp.]|nr:hypothetical protein [Nitrospira sp.]
MILSPLRHLVIGVFLLALFEWAAVSAVDAKPLYSYTDEKGTRIITDNYYKIPPSYRAKVTTVEQEGDGYVGEIERVGEFVGSAKGFVVPVPGMSLQQSKIITYAALFALLCVLAMNFSRSEVIRALALWSLVLTGICAPVLVYTADDGAAAIMKKKAAEIQQKQQDRLSHAQ